MIKVISAARRNPELSASEFKHQMRVDHAPLIARMPGVAGYVVNFAAGSGPTPWDAVVELTFEDESAFKLAIGSDAGQEALVHMRKLVDVTTIQSGIFEVAE